MELLYGRAGRLTALNDGFRPGQSHAVSLEKRVRKLVSHRQNEKLGKKDFDRGISGSFVDFMVSIFGNYREFIDEDFEFEVRA
jgi:hypothetical protein